MGEGQVQNVALGGIQKGPMWTRGPRRGSRHNRRVQCEISPAGCSPRATPHTAKDNGSPAGFPLNSKFPLKCKGRRLTCRPLS